MICLVTGGSVAAAGAFGKVYSRGRRKANDKEMNVLKPSELKCEYAVNPFDIGSRVLYVTRDVTGLLASGANAVGVMLGHGWYSSNDGKSKRGDG